MRSVPLPTLVVRAFRRPLTTRATLAAQAQLPGRHASAGVFPVLRKSCLLPIFIFPRPGADRPRAVVLSRQWDGKNLYKSDQSHSASIMSLDGRQGRTDASHLVALRPVAYPVDTYQGGNCPSTHPVHIVSIFYEWVRVAS